jgi:hypothetical protein
MSVSVDLDGSDEGGVPVTCDAALRAADVYLRYMTNESKLRLVINSLLVPASATQSYSWTRVKALFEVQVKSKSLYRGGTVPHYWSSGVPDVETGLWKAFNDPFMYNNNIAENPARDRACPDFPLLHWKAYVWRSCNLASPATGP